MKSLVSCLAVLLLVVGAATAQASTPAGPCAAVDEISFPSRDQVGTSFTTPPYVAVEATGELKRFVRRSRPFHQEVAFDEAQTACLEELTGARLTALRAEAAYAFKLQAPAGTVLVFHVASLAGGEALVSSGGMRLLSEADRLAAEGRTSEAAVAYEAVIQAGVRPWEAAVAHAALAGIDKAEGRIESALEHVSLAVEAYPRLASAQAEKAILEEEVARLQAARREERRGVLASQIAALQAAGQFLGAIPLAEEALALAEESFGPESIELASYLDTLAGLYEAAGRDGEAEPLFRQALAIREFALGTDDPETEKSRRRLAALNERMIQAEAQAAAVEVEPLKAAPLTAEPAGEREVSPWLEPEPIELPPSYAEEEAPSIISGEIVKSLLSNSEPLEIEPATLTSQEPIETIQAVGEPLLSPPEPDSDAAGEAKAGEAAAPAIIPMESGGSQEVK